MANLIRVSGPSPFANCKFGGAGTAFTNTEVEPWIAVNPNNPRNLIGVWQQDRWSNGFARGIVAGFSFDGGKHGVDRSFPSAYALPLMDSTTVGQLMVGCPLDPMVQRLSMLSNRARSPNGA